MIITQTPLRISFSGGGSDLPAYYRRSGGAVVSAAINRYVYVAVNKKFDHGIRLSYSKTEEVECVDQIEHKLVRAAFKVLGLDGGIEITSVADVPSRGTGLGSSSSFTVGLLHALHAYKSCYISARDLGAESCRLEIDICLEKIGKQDQYAAAFGGLNFIRFEPNDDVSVEPIICRPEKIKQMEQSLILFYTGITRSASTVLEQQTLETERNGSTQNLLTKMVELAYVLRAELNRGNIDAVGSILHEGWCLKREIHSGISSTQIDDWYAMARRAGAEGGKLLGAGGGGFLMFYAPPERHEEIERALPLRRFDVGFERSGSRVILYQG